MIEEEGSEGSEQGIPTVLHQKSKKTYQIKIKMSLNASKTNPNMYKQAEKTNSYMYKLTKNV